MREVIVRYKWLIATVLAAATGYVMYRLWKRRPIRFRDSGHATGLNMSKYGYGGDDTDIGGNLGFVLNSSHPFKIGSRIVIKHDGTPPYPTYDGEAVVVRLIGDRVIITDKGFEGSSDPQPGTINLI